MSESYARVEVHDLEELHVWLMLHHASTPGIWLVRRRRGAGAFSYADLVRELLAFGWIDSRPRGVDDEWTSCLITPRRPGSAWSKVNKDQVAALTAVGRTQPAGQEAVDRARADGSWNRLNEVEELVEPADLTRALDAVPAARASWDGFPRSTKRAILEWITSAKREETRERRVRQTVAEAAVGRRANQWRQPGPR
jgi:uncharacterized protein YdeI (YjbR/CyaY-like superfamily)